MNLPALLGKLASAITPGPALSTAPGSLGQMKPNQPTGQGMASAFGKSVAPAKPAAAVPALDGIGKMAAAEMAALGGVGASAAMAQPPAPAPVARPRVLTTGQPAPAAQPRVLTSNRPAPQQPYQAPLSQANPNFPTAQQYRQAGSPLTYNNWQKNMSATGAKADAAATARSAVGSTYQSPKQKYGSDQEDDMDVIAQLAKMAASLTDPPGAPNIPSSPGQSKPAPSQQSPGGYRPGNSMIPGANIPSASSLGPPPSQGGAGAVKPAPSQQSPGGYRPGNSMIPGANIPSASSLGPPPSQGGAGAVKPAPAAPPTQGGAQGLGQQMGANFRNQVQQMAQPYQQMFSRMFGPGQPPPPSPSWGIGKGVQSIGQGVQDAIQAPGNFTRDMFGGVSGQKSMQAAPAANPSAGMLGGAASGSATTHGSAPQTSSSYDSQPRLIQAPAPAPAPAAQPPKSPAPAPPAQSSASIPSGQTSTYRGGKKVGSDLILGLAKLAAQASTDGPMRRSSTGSSKGLSFNNKPDHYSNGPDAWKSVSGYLKKKPDSEPDPYSGKHADDKQASWQERIGGNLLSSLEGLGFFVDKAANSLTPMQPIGEGPAAAPALGRTGPMKMPAIARPNIVTSGPLGGQRYHGGTVSNEGSHAVPNVFQKAAGVADMSKRLGGGMSKIPTAPVVGKPAPGGQPRIPIARGVGAPPVGNALASLQQQRVTPKMTAEMVGHAGVTKAPDTVNMLRSLPDGATMDRMHSIDRMQPKSSPSRGSFNLGPEHEIPQAIPVGKPVQNSSFKLGPEHEAPGMNVSLPEPGDTNRTPVWNPHGAEQAQALRNGRMRITPDQLQNMQPHVGAADMLARQGQATSAGRSPAVGGLPDSVKVDNAVPTAQDRMPFRVAPQDKGSVPYAFGGQSGKIRRRNQLAGAGWEGLGTPMMRDNLPQLDPRKMAEDMLAKQADDALGGSDESGMRRGWQWKAMAGEANENLKNWMPRMITTPYTPVAETLASPAKQGLLKGLGGAAIGGGIGLGTALGTQGLTPTQKTLATLLGAGVGGVIGGIHGYTKRRKDNDEILDKMHHMPPGVTLGEIEGLKKAGMLSAASGLDGSGGAGGGLGENATMMPGPSLMAEAPGTAGGCGGRSETDLGPQASRANPSHDTDMFVAHQTQRVRDNAAKVAQASDDFSFQFREFCSDGQVIIKQAGLVRSAKTMGNLAMGGEKALAGAAPAVARVAKPMVNEAALAARAGKGVAEATKVNPLRAQAEASGGYGQVAKDLWNEHGNKVLKPMGVGLGAYGGYNDPLAQGEGEEGVTGKKLLGMGLGAASSLSLKPKGKGTAVGGTLLGGMRGRWVGGMTGDIADKLSEKVTGVHGQMIGHNPDGSPVYAGTGYGDIMRGLGTGVGAVRGGGAQLSAIGNLQKLKGTSLGNVASTVGGNVEHLGEGLGRGSNVFGRTAHAALGKAAPQLTNHWSSQGVLGSAPQSLNPFKGMNFGGSLALLGGGTAATSYLLPKTRENISATVAGEAVPNMANEAQPYINANIKQVTERANQVIEQGQQRARETADQLRKETMDKVDQYLQERGIMNPNTHRVDLMGNIGYGLKERLSDPHTLQMLQMLGLGLGAYGAFSGHPLLAAGGLGLAGYSNPQVRQWGSNALGQMQGWGQQGWNNARDWGNRQYQGLTGRSPSGNIGGGNALAEEHALARG